MTLELAATIIPSFAILFIGAIVYFHNRKSATSVLFLIMSIATVLWAVANFYSVNVPPVENLRWIRLVLFFAAPHVVFFFIFVYNFPATRFRMNKKTFILLMLLLVITMGAAISPFVFTDVLVNDGVATPLPGTLMPLFGAVILGSLIASIVVMVRKYFTVSLVEKVQWRAMIVGTFLSYILLIITNFVFVVIFENTFFNAYGPLFMLPAFFGMSYAIVRHNVLNVKVIGAEILTFIILAISLFELFTANGGQEVLLKLLIFLLFFFFGIFLIQSVIKEVNAREKIELLAGDLKVANERLKELDQRKSEFVSLASHQLRSPLTAIKGYASMLLEGSFGGLTDKTKEAVDRIFQSSERLVTIVEDFLTISRIEQGRLAYNFASADVGALAQTVISDTRPSIEKRGLAMSFDFEKGKQFFAAIDTGKITQVIANLIDNAAKYTPAGSITIRMSKNEEKHTIRFSVSDTGIGMSQETKSKVFSKFVRADNAHEVNVSGAGLGLFIAKQLIDAHHGTIGAESDGEGKGSTFYFELPAVSLSNPPAE